MWLGPVGGANYRRSAATREDAGDAGDADGAWDSAIGGQLSIVRVRERRSLAALGGAFGASLWTARGGGRLWLDAIAGTRLGKMMGLSAGPLLELAETRHPRLGGSVGIWAFLGVTPYAKVGYADGLGSFVEVGMHIALPAFRR